MPKKHDKKSLFIQHLVLKNQKKLFFTTFPKRQVSGANHHECGVIDLTDIFQSHLNLS